MTAVEVSESAFVVVYLTDASWIGRLASGIASFECEGYFVVEVCDTVDCSTVSPGLTSSHRRYPICNGVWTEMCIEDVMAVVYPSYSPYGEFLLVSYVCVSDCLSTSHVEYEPNVSIPVVCATVGIGLDSHSRTIGVTGVPCGFKYGGVNEAVTDTTVCHVIVGEVEVDTCVCAECCETATGPGYFAHITGDLCNLTTKLTSCESRDAGGNCMSPDASECTEISTRDTKKTPLNSDRHSVLVHYTTGTLMLTPMLSPATVCIIGRSVYATE